MGVGNNTGIRCPFCNDKVQYSESVVLLEVHQAKTFEEVLTNSTLCIDVHGNYSFPPIFIHEECWAELLDEIGRLSENRQLIPSDTVIMICTSCQGDISLDDYFTKSEFGTMSVSSRSQTNTEENSFERSGTSKPICLECIAVVIDEYLEEWSEIFDVLDIPRPDERDDED